MCNWGCVCVTVGGRGCVACSVQGRKLQPFYTNSLTAIDRFIQISTIFSFEQTQMHRASNDSFEYKVIHI